MLTRLSFHIGSIQSLVFLTFLLKPNLELLWDRFNENEKFDIIGQLFEIKLLISCSSHQKQVFLILFHLQGEGNKMDETPRGEIFSCSLE